MTRNEVVKILGDNNLPPAFADVLVAWKLIKFDEEKQIDSPLMVIKNELVNLQLSKPMNSTSKADYIINALYKAGYKIVRKVD